VPNLRATTVALLLLLLLALGLATGGASAAERDTVLELGPVALLGDGPIGIGPTYAELGLGAFDIVGEGRDETSGAAMLQLRLGYKLYGIGPTIGLMANTDGGVFGFGGIYADLAWGDVIITPVLALGGYREGDSKDLGGVFQFRSEVGVAYEFADGSRLGLRGAHISNAGVHADNPGEEEIFITYAVPLRF